MHHIPNLKDTSCCQRKGILNSALKTDVIYTFHIQRPKNNFAIFVFRESTKGLLLFIIWRHTRHLNSMKLHTCTRCSDGKKIEITHQYCYHVKIGMSTLI